MDRIESLTNTISNLTMYDIKSMYTQAKNVVLNVSEIEAKVREATNDEPWGASSTLMQDIASRTFNYPEFNEIMPAIYSRFMEKEARQWRQIYKALQLLEYLIKNGSERVVDDARAHVGTIKMLRNFHYIDDKGKDEGLNIRNRAKEIVELLSDVDKIRAERRKAKANKNKYIGTGNDGLSFSSGGSRYGGFGNESVYSGGGGSSAYGGSSSNDFYTSGGGGGGGGSSSFRDTDTRKGYEEYDAGDDEDLPVSQSRRSGSINKRSTPTTSSSRKAAAATPAPAPVKEVNLIDGWDDDTFGSTTTAPATAPQVNKALPTVATSPVGAATKPAANLFDDDDFGDFSAAPTASPPAPAVAPVAAAPVRPQQGAGNANLMAMLGSPSAASTPTAQPGAGLNLWGALGSQGQAQQPQQHAPMGMGMGGMGMHRSQGSMGMGMGMQPSMGMGMQPSMGMGGTNMGMGMGMARANTTSPTPAASRLSTSTAASTPTTQKASGGFDDLWSMSLGSSSAANKPATGGKSMKDLEKEKASSGLWGGAPAAGGGFGGIGGVSAGGAANAPTMGSGFGSFGSSTPASSGGGGLDDLLG